MKEKFEIIAIKRKWSLINIVMYLNAFIALFLTIAASVDSYYEILWIGIILDIIFIPILILKIIQPKIIITYNDYTKTIRCYKFKKCFEIRLEEINRINYFDYREQAILIIHLKNKKRTIFFGVKHVDKVASKMEQLL